MWDRCTDRDIYNLGYGAETKCEPVCTSVPHLVSAPELKFYLSLSVHLSHI
jgi:hypothetical protein